MGSIIKVPISSITNIPFIIKPTKRTMPPTLGADIASFIVPRLKRPIFLPESNANDIATVTIPMPPI